ncbi:hypothetical protein [Streptomyces fradiae]|uniref:hypothetical protein n=1 Tax=Streptomyces fradiae TaxID=1906 RepID=UPI00351578BB
MATPEREDRTADVSTDTVPMRVLLAACAAATAVSTPPRARETADEEPDAPAVQDEAA